jgi:hypothetical protein
MISGVIPASKLFRKDQIDEALKRGLRRDAARLRRGQASSDIAFLSVDGQENTPSNRLFASDGGGEEIGLILLGANARGDLSAVHLDPIEADALIIMAGIMSTRYTRDVVRAYLLPTTMRFQNYRESEYYTSNGRLSIERRKKHKNTAVTVSVLGRGRELISREEFTL